MSDAAPHADPGPSRSPGEARSSGKVRSGDVADDCARPGRCPSCDAPLGLKDLAVSPAAPLFIRCRSCRGSCRYGSIVQYATTIAWGMVGVVIALVVAALTIGFVDWPRRIASGLFCGLVSATTVGIYTLRCVSLAAAGGSFRADRSTRRYVVSLLAVSFVGVALLLFAAMPIISTGVRIELGGLAMPTLSKIDRGEPLEARWTLRTLEGEPVEFDSLRGRPVFLNLWATWCAPCVAELPDIESLYGAVADAGVTFVIASNESADRAGSFVAKKGFRFPVYTFDGSVPLPFSTSGIPATFILDREGRLVYRHVGRADWDARSVRVFLLELAEES